MLLHKRRRTPYGVQIPMTSLIDVVFLLLIYFLLTTNFMAEEGIKINLPEAQAVAPQVDAEVTIHIDQMGRIYLQSDRVEIPVLLDRLRSSMTRPRPPLVVVKADRTVIIDKVVEVMDVAKAAGAERMLLATERGF